MVVLYWLVDSSRVVHLEKHWEGRCRAAASEAGFAEENKVGIRMERAGHSLEGFGGDGMWACLDGMEHLEAVEGFGRDGTEWDCCGHEAEESVQMAARGAVEPLCEGRDITRDVVTQLSCMTLVEGRVLI